MLTLKRSWGESALTLAFYLLFFLTPLLFEFKTRELFEFPKMIFIYLWAALLTYLYLIFRSGALPKSTPLLKPFLIFLLLQALATFFSTDLYSSVWGYYSRFNGGLISIIAFFLIFLILSQTLNVFRQKTVLGSLLAGGFFISFYTLLQNLGLDKDFWVQDSQARAFATLGQPNWLAAYLLMILPLALYLYLKAETFPAKAVFFSLTFLFYYALWSTYSLSGFLGFIFLVLMIALFSKELVSKKRTKISVLVLACLFLSVSRPGIFGVKVESFFKTLWPKISSAGPSQARASRPEPVAATSVVTPASGPTKAIDTGDIRLSVWQGALNLWKSSPKIFLFGAGPETFAYNFLPFRPESLNQTTEWDFLYNKAHNYYLDLLTGSGLLGFLAFVLFSLSVVRAWYRQRSNPPPLATSSSPLADFFFYGWTTTLVTNFFGWPTVPLSLLFFTYPVLMENVSEKNSLTSKEPTEPLLPWGKFIIITVPLLFVLILFINIFLADVSFSQGLNQTQRSELNEAVASLRDAVSLNYGEPAYHKELSFVLAQATLLKEGHSGRVILAQASADEARLAENLNPKNSLTLRSLVRTYYLLSRLNSRYKSDLEELGQRIVALSPTDPQARYDLALIYSFLEKKDQSLKLVGEALGLRPNYPEAQELLGKLNKE